MRELGLDSSGSRQKKIGGFCEHGNKHWVSQNTKNALTSCGVAQEGLRSMKFVISGWNWKGNKLENESLV